MAGAVLCRSSAGAAGATPPPPGRGCGAPLVQDVLDVALGDLQPLALEVRGDLAHGQVPKLFRGELVQVGLDALALGDPRALATGRGRQAGLPILLVFRKAVACPDDARGPRRPAARQALGRNVPVQPVRAPD